MTSELQDRVIELCPLWPINGDGAFRFRQLLWDEGKARELVIVLPHNAQFSYFLTFINGNYYAFWNNSTVLTQCEIIT